MKIWHIMLALTFCLSCGKDDGDNSPEQTPESEESKNLDTPEKKIEKLRLSDEQTRSFVLVSEQCLNEKAEKSFSKNFKRSVCDCYAKDLVVNQPKLIENNKVNDEKSAAPVLKKCHDQSVEKMKSDESNVLKFQLAAKEVVTVNNSKAQTQYQLPVSSKMTKVESELLVDKKYNKLLLNKQNSSLTTEPGDGPCTWKVKLSEDGGVEFFAQPMKKNISKDAFELVESISCSAMAELTYLPTMEVVMVFASASIISDSE